MLKRIGVSGRVQGAGRSVGMRRVWYADDVPETGNPSQAQTPPPAGDGGQGEGGRFKSVDDATNYVTALEKRLAERAAELEQLKTFRQEQLTKTGNYEELLKESQSKLTTLEPKAKQFDELLEEIRDDNKKRVASMPEDRRHIVPDIDPVALRCWLDKAIPVLTRPQAPNVDGGAGVSGGASGVSVTAADIAASEASKAFGYFVSPEDIAKRRLGQK